MRIVSNLTACLFLLHVAGCAKLLVGMPGGLGAEQSGSGAGASNGDPPNPSGNLNPLPAPPGSPTVTVQTQSSITLDFGVVLNFSRPAVRALLRGPDKWDGPTIH